MDKYLHLSHMDALAEQNNSNSEEAKVGGDISASTDADSGKDQEVGTAAESKEDEEADWSSAKEPTSETDQQSEKSVSRPASETSTPVRVGSPFHVDNQPVLDRSGFPHRVGISWTAGAKLEAKDFMAKWYPAKIVEVDDSDNTVLIHFDGWNQRYDEWVDMDSDRIRPMTRHSERRERREKAKVVSKPQAEHRLGENVFAKWSDCRMYPATIVSINTSGTYDVVFYDGFKKTVQSINVRNMPEEVQAEYARSGLLPELGKKQKQKIRELMKSAEAIPDSATKRRSSSGSTSDKERTKSEFKSKDDSELSSAETSPSEKVAPSTSGTSPGSGATPSGSRANVKTVPAANAKKRKLASTEGFQAKKLKTSTPPSRVNTKVKVKQSPNVKQKQKDATKSSLMKHSSSGSKQTGQGDAGDDSCLMQMLESGEKVVARKEFKVEDDHYPYHCQYKGCDKGFRKESLLQYHMKYYHTPDGGVVAVPPIRKRKKTTSVCSTDSEVSIGNKVPGAQQRPAKRKRDSLASSSISSLPDPVFEASEHTADHSLDTSEVDSKTTTTEEGETQDALADDTLDREGEEEAEDELSRDDVVNCICQINEESGLMIQCEVCLCWQHALCMEITAETLPSKYICYVCLNPPGVRDSARFSYDQDWLKHGMLARFNFLPEDPNDQRKSQIMQATHELVSDMHGVSRALHSTKCKLHILKEKKKCDKELRVWETDWDAVERKQRQQQQQEQLKEEEMEQAGDASEQDSHLVQQQQSTESEVDIQVTDSSSENKDSSAVPATPEVEPPATASAEQKSSHTEKENDVKNTEQSTEQKEPVSTNTTEPSTSQPSTATTTQNPKDVLAVCEDNLFTHIDGMQDKIEEQLDFIENQVAALESAEETSGRSGDILRDLPRVKKAVHQVIGDLTKVRRMALFH